MVKQCALDRINTILAANSFRTSFGHSLRIGGASSYLAQKMDLEIICLAGRWKSLAYEVYCIISINPAGVATCYMSAEILNSADRHFLRYHHPFWTAFWPKNEPNILFLSM